MRKKLETLLQGSSPSHLKQLLGQKRYDYLYRFGLLEPVAGLADIYVLNGCHLSIREEEDSYRAEGWVGTMNEDVEIQQWEAQRKRLNLPQFLTEILNLDYFEKKLSWKTLKQGEQASKLCSIECLGTDLYFAPHSSDSEFAFIQRDAGDFSRKTVIITPDHHIPAAYASSIGNIQHLTIDELWENAMQEEDAAPITYYIRPGHTKADKTLPPYRVFQGIELGKANWQDIRIKLRADRKIVLTVNGKDKTYPEEHVYFTRSTINSENDTSKQVRLLRLMAYLQRWNKVSDALQKAIQRLNVELKTFFCQTKAFYSIDDEGKYSLRIKLELDEELKDLISQTHGKLRDDASRSGLAKAIDASGRPDTRPRKARTHNLSDSSISLLDMMLN